MNDVPDADLVYLHHVLDHDARGNLAALVAARNSRVVGRSTLVEPGLDREDAREVLTDVAKSLDHLDGDDVRRRVQDLDLSRWPDLAAWRHKLVTTLDARPAYAAAHRDSNVDPEVFDTIWALAICPERDAPQVRDLFERGIAYLRLRRAARTTRRLRRRHPAVWATHRAFVDRVEKVWGERRVMKPRHWWYLLGVMASAVAMWAMLGGIG